MIGFLGNEGRKSIHCAVGSVNGKEQHMNTLKPCNAQIPKKKEKEANKNSDQQE